MSQIDGYRSLLGAAMLHYLNCVSQRYLVPYADIDLFSGPWQCDNFRDRVIVFAQNLISFNAAKKETLRDSYSGTVKRQSDETRQTEPSWMRYAMSVNQADVRSSFQRPDRFQN